MAESATAERLKQGSATNKPVIQQQAATAEARQDASTTAPPSVSRLSLPFAMIAGESFIQQTHAINLRSAMDDTAYDHITGTLFMTSARLWFEPDEVAGDALRAALEKKGALRSKSIPIRYVTQATVRKVAKKPVLRLQFDNGGREYFRIATPLKWRDDILTAVPKAPDSLPFSFEPSYRHGVEYKGHLIIAALKTVIALAVIAAIAAFFEPLWRPYVPRVIALVESLVRR